MEGETPETGTITKSCTALGGEVRKPKKRKQDGEKAGLGHKQLSWGKDLQLITGMKDRTAGRKIGKGVS